MTNNTADVIIIGAGVHGASLAFHLARRGVKAIVLEKSFVGAGATGRSSGLVRMHYDLRQDTELAWASFKYFHDWKEMVGGDCGFTRTGFLQFVSHADIETLIANVEMHREIGVPVELINADDVKRLAPSFNTDDIEVAAYEPESGYAMPSDTANSMLAAARTGGTRLIQDCAVTGVLTSGGKVTGVESTAGAFSAPVVVNAAGPWAANVNAMAGVDLPYDTWQHDTMFVKRPVPLEDIHPTVIDFANDLYFRPEGPLTLVGLQDGNPMGESPDTDTKHSRQGFIERAIDRICKRIPGMEHGHMHSAHGGYDGITPDQHPVIGAIGPEGYYVDCGFSGTGFKIAPAVGQSLSELILDGRVSSVDISIYAPQRFAEGREIVGEHAYSTIWH